MSHHNNWQRQGLASLQLHEPRPRQLHTALGALPSRNINLAHIEPRPTGDELGNYVFVLDILGHRTAPDVTVALADLSRTASFMKVLGSYPTAIGVAT